MFVTKVIKYGQGVWNMAEKVPKTSKVSMENCFFQIVGYNFRPF
jgi:hypothetical protein